MKKEILEIMARQKEEKAQRAKESCVRHRPNDDREMEHPYALIPNVNRFLNRNYSQQRMVVKQYIQTTSRPSFACIAAA